MPPTFQELGTTGLKRWAGTVDEEFLRELQGPRGVKAYREMNDNDPIVGAITFAIDMLLRGVTWRVEPASDETEDVEHAEFLKSCRDDMSTTWPDTISEILSFLRFGWSYHEIVYKRRLGPNRDPSRNSRFNDGRIGWRKFPIRAQETLDEWVFDDNGGIQAMAQNAPPTFERRVIPIDKALLFRTTTFKNNPEGKSILRNAYRPWYFKRNIETIEGIGIERDLAGLPKARAPWEWFHASATDDQKAALQALKDVVRNIRRDEQESLVIPGMYDDKGNLLLDVELMSTGGRRQFDTDAIVARYDQRIAMVVLADFILLGHENVGSQSLGGSKIDLFRKALTAWLGVIASTFNRHAVPRLFALNGLSPAELPRLVPGDVSDVDLDGLGEYLEHLSKAGMPLFPDEGLEAHLRDVGGLPERTEEKPPVEDDEEGDE